MLYKYPIYIVGAMTQSGSTKVHASLLYYLKKYKNQNTLGFHDGDLPWVNGSAFDSPEDCGTKARNFLKYLNIAPIVIKSHDWSENSAVQYLIGYMDMVQFVFIGCYRDLRDAYCSWLRKGQREVDDESMNKYLRKQADLCIKWSTEFIDAQAERMREDFQWIQYRRPVYYHIIYEEFEEAHDAFAKIICTIGDISDKRGFLTFAKIHEDIINFFNIELLQLANNTQNEMKNEYRLTASHITNGGRSGAHKEYLSPEQIEAVNLASSRHLKQLTSFYRDYLIKVDPTGGGHMKVHGYLPGARPPPGEGG